MAPSLLTRALWAEPPEDAERRRGHLLVSGACTALVGLFAGVLAVERGGLPPLSTPLLGACAGLLLTYVAGQVESFSRAVGRARGPGAGTAVRLGSDAAGGALLGHLLGSALDADALAALAVGATLLVVWGTVTTRLFWGGWVEDTVRLLTGQAGAVVPAPDYSFAESLAARGLVGEALAEFERICADRPGDPVPTLHAAWILRSQGRREEALAWFRRALDTPGLDAARAYAARRQVRELEGLLSRPGGEAVLPPGA